MPKPASVARALSERERRFVEAYMGKAAGNATKAAILAGYSEHSAAAQSSRLLRKRKIREAIDTRVAKDPKIASRQERQHFWSDVLHGRGKFSKTPMKDRLKASELLGKSQGDFIERHEHGGPGGGPIETKVVFGGRHRPQPSP